MSKPVEGLIALLATPFDANQDIDEPAFRAQIQWCLARGADGIVAAPSVGEFAHLTASERYRLFEMCAEETAAHPRVLTMAMTSDATTRQALEHTRVARELGFDCALVVPPYYWLPTQEEVYGHFARLAEAGLPVCVYHNPGLTKFVITPAFMARLLAIPGVAAAKEVVTDLNHLTGLFAAVGPRARILHVHRAYVQCTLMGGVGATMAPFALPAAVRCREHLNGGRIRQALEIQNIVTALLPAHGDEQSGLLGMWKAAAALAMGIDLGPPRAPYGAPPPAVLDRIRAALDRLRGVLA